MSGPSLLMTEFEEFAYALLDQLSVEINEEKEIISSKEKADQAFASKIKFEEIESICNRIYSDMSKKITEFTGIPVTNTKIEFPELVGFKQLKGRKVYPTKESAAFVDELFTAIAHEDVQKIASLAESQTFRYLVYSTYAKGYISQISTTYGDYYESAVYLNKFILSSYPQIILYKQGEPYEPKFEQVNSGYIGALKMTILEEQIHSIQSNLYNMNKNAVTEVNAINEELAKIILGLDDNATKNLYNYLQLPEVPDEYPVAKRANLFFILNPDNFIVQVLGPDVMTFTKVTVDPKILEMIPQLLDIYQRWLKPIQAHHAAFTTMEGMAEFAVKNILKDDKDFGNYLVTFANSDISSYQVRKSMGTDFTEHVFAKIGKDTYKTLIANPPTTRELKSPESYLNRK
ncbi:conserved hypothetical protein [Nitrosotalea sinensis]|uniref:Uncharacterized protein n=2 Tax=Nitrosotalea sinensis TaxID=1499975 RepID=A0A2H1EGA4_9ARCH|nr:conserved hypothetical protein [Candidatus Nitrosotalea sinensis]